MATQRNKLKRFYLNGYNCGLFFTNEESGYFYLKGKSAVPFFWRMYKIPVPKFPFNYINDSLLVLNKSAKMHSEIISNLNLK